MCRRATTLLLLKMRKLKLNCRFSCIIPHDLQDTLQNGCLSEVLFSTDHFTTYTIGETEYESFEEGSYLGMKAVTYDTDGDGTTEYMVCVQDSKSPEETDDGEPVAYSAISFYAYDFTKISDLIIIEDGIYKGYTTAKEREENKVLLDLSMVEYIDYDEDNIMEIIVDIPQWEEMLIDIFKYSAYELSGEKIVIDNFQELPNQVIFTATLKQEEYNKYDKSGYNATGVILKDEATSVASQNSSIYRLS